MQIRQLMSVKGISITELARRVGVKYSHISNIIAGRKRPSVDLAIRISDVFGVSVNALMRDNSAASNGKRSPHSRSSNIGAESASRAGEEKMGGDKSD